MKKILLLSSLLIPCACSDQNDIFNNVQENIKNEGVVMTVPEFVWEENLTTRTALTPTSSGMSFAWKSGDQVGIYTGATSMANFDIDQISQDAKSATFNGGGFSLTEGSNYYAFYPYDAASTNKMSVAVDYTEQTQLANNDCSHLAAYDYMVANATATNTNVAAFDFEHLGAIVKIKIRLPKDGTFTSLMISSDKPVFTKGTVNLTIPLVSISSAQSSNNVVLNLANIQSADKTLVAYLMFPPTDMSGVELICTIKDSSDKIYIGTITGKNMQAGTAYGYSISVSDPFNGHNYVDLGLKDSEGRPVYWATCNIGASNPEEHGDHFAWGATSPQSIYDWPHTPYQTQNTTDDKSIKFTKYLGSTTSFYKDGSAKDSDAKKALLDSEDDAASVNWGGAWRMPTHNEQLDLIAQCYWQWVTSYKGKSVNGFVVFRAKVDADKGKFPQEGKLGNPDTPAPIALYSIDEDPHIFLPAAGYYLDGRLIGSQSMYYSSSLLIERPDYVYFLSFDSGNVGWSYFSRCSGYSIRPVICL